MSNTWLKSAVFYEIYPNSFMDGNDDGYGDFVGMTAKLDYIKTLGANAVWLNPHYDSPFMDGGYDVRDLSRTALRKNIGIVAQDVFLFNGTIKENIAYGDFDATDEQIFDAAKKANIHDYVSSLPDGYDTNVGERGIKLSGGQKQRIAIARAFLKNPPVLILDEATSALDNATEMLIQDALNELSEGRTTIVVAHRLSTVKNADEIVVITADGIEERGTHEQLLARDGLYKSLYEYQFKNL